jgi:enediyne core biosynthesis thioesterase
MTRVYEYHHVVGFEETNLVGNVYYVNHLRWQGRCRELFLRDHAPDVLAELSGDLRLVTLHCACDYLAELTALEQVVVRMRLGHLGQTQLDLEFEYVRQRPRGGDELVAVGSQRVACMRWKDGGLIPATVPASLRLAIQPYRRVTGHARGPADASERNSSGEELEARVAADE